ncbi:uncharacterized protein N7459_001560 [Penicillium hispanicum]|uniref:uncharacterized protein n=1 Tax=Penicillium hispanicum TaxID=1080232 RepID=UPI002540184F|nr:uncharacterized protein N7459_001560 [Penicillium hispanicum]KAJ5595352.1 hypothetical protein N7459_001560 [Penicillium hispanicum]
MSSSPKIAIVGGGPAGLTVGLLLHKQHIPFTIFELRSKPTDEELAKPSGSLDLHEESGIAAIKEGGLYDQFLQWTGECSEAQKVSDKDGNILWTDEGELSERPEISRHALTQLLSAGVPAESIQYDHKLYSATSVPGASGAQTELDFGPHGKQTFDLVVGADGAWSKVRGLLTDVAPAYTGTQGITVTIRQITSKYPHLAELVGRGSFTALGLRHGVMSQRGPLDSARIYIVLTTADENFAAEAGVAGRPPAAAADRLLNDDALLGGFGPLIKELVAVACDEDSADNPGADVDVRPIYALPIGASWEHRPGATIIGDAAHLMGPWAGEGVNLAMWDSLLLARAIIRAHEAAARDNASFQKTLDPLIRDFEVDMVERAKEKAEETHRNGQMLFGPDGAKAFANFFASFFAEMHGGSGGL